MIMDDYYKDELKQLTLIALWQNGGTCNTAYIKHSIYRFQKRLVIVRSKTLGNLLERFENAGDALDSGIPNNPKDLKREEYRFKVALGQKKIYLTRQEIADFLGVSKQAVAEMSSFKTYLYKDQIFRHMNEIRTEYGLTYRDVKKKSKRFDFKIEKA